jgi:hypothetical protein
MSVAGSKRSRHVGVALRLDARRPEVDHDRLARSDLPDPMSWPTAACAPCETMNSSKVIPLREDIGDRAPPYRAGTAG